MIRARFFLIFLLAGCFSQVIQILMSREILVVFYGNEISLGVFYAAWLFWIALGSCAFGVLSRKIFRPFLWFPCFWGSFPSPRVWTF